jgi:drug/metabolite transporter (DMT)-like permease
MLKNPVFYAVLTALFWGLYAPTLGESRSFLKSPFKPYLLIGLAYLVWGIGGGIVGMINKGDSFSFTLPGISWGFAAGSLGAFGALTLTLAMYNKGEAHTVMPIVFGGAVTVSAIAGALRSTHPVNPMLWVGIAGILVCTVMVTYFTPHAAPPGKAAPPASTAVAPAPQEMST